MEITDLPAEMLEQVHQWLPLPALKEAALVSEQWRKVAEDPTLWKWCKVTVYNKDDIANLAIRRIKDIREIKINPQNWDVEDWKTFFLATMELLSLKFIDGLKLSDKRARDTVEKEVFARALVKLEVVELLKTPYQQIEELFREMERSTKIKKVDFCEHDLSRMDPSLFAIVLSRLEDVHLSHNETTHDQMQAFFSQIVEQNCLKRLDLSEKSVSYLEPGLFAEALAKVEEVTLRNLFYGYDQDEDDEDDNGDQLQTNDQIKALFTEMSHSTQMKKLDLFSFDLSQVESEKFAKALSRLETVNLNRCDVTNDQMQALFTEMLPKTQTKKLEFFAMDLHLSQLEPGLVAGVLAKLEEVSLGGHGGSSLTSDQVQAFFTEASLSTHLKTLAMSDVDLSHVDSEVFAQAVTRLEEVNLWQSRITDDQSQSLFTKMAVSTKLKKLEITNENKETMFSSVSPVTPQVLATALNKLDEVTLGSVFSQTRNRLFTRPTHDHVEAFFTEMTQGTKLKKLTCHEDISSVNPQVLARALNKLDELNMLCFARLTLDQAETFFLEMARESKLKKLHLDDHDLSALNPEILGSALTKLKEATLKNTNLTQEKIEAVLNHVLEAEGSKLKKLIWDTEDGWMDESLNPETVRMLRDKFGGEFDLN